MVNARFDFDCVRSADDLGRDDVRHVTLTGQVQALRRAEHDGQQQRITGFATAARIAELHDGSDALIPVIVEVDHRGDELDRKSTALRARNAGWEVIERARWESLGLATAEARIADIEYGRRTMPIGPEYTLETRKGMGNAPSSVTRRSATSI